MTTQELQDARAMHGDSRSQSVAHHPGEGAELGACIDIPGLNRAASQERFWPSCAGRCEGPPHSYVRMPFGLPSVASAYQHNLFRILAAQEARHHAVLAEMATVLQEPPGPQSLLRLRTLAAHEGRLLQLASSATSTPLEQRYQVTLSGSFSWGHLSGSIISKSHGPVPATCILLHL